MYGFRSAVVGDKRNARGKSRNQDGRGEPQSFILMDNLIQGNRLLVPCRSMGLVDKSEDKKARNAQDKTAANGRHEAWTLYAPLIIQRHAARIDR
jgi:hypothetical protein